MKQLNRVLSLFAVTALLVTANSMAAKLREFRRSDQAKLVRSQKTTQLAIDSLPDAVAVIGPDARVEMANQTARRMFGLLPQTELAQLLGCAVQHVAVRGG